MMGLNGTAKAALVSQDVSTQMNDRRLSISLPPRAREELKSLLRTQNEAQERVRLVLSKLEEALGVPSGWVIRDVNEGFVEVLPGQ